MSFKVSLVFVCALLAASGQAASVSRVVGGDNAYDGQFPYQISLRRSGSHICGGSIIGKHFILTAAHCVVESGITPYPAELFAVRAGTCNRLSGGMLINVKKITVNEKYANFLYDVAVLELEEPLIFSARIQPIELATEEVPPGSDVVVSGWGRLWNDGDIPFRLQYNTLQSISKLKCLTSIGMYSDTLLCLSHEAENGVCNGDSGGPAMFNEKLVGVAGFVVNGCGSTNPDGYAKVSHHTEWINALIK